MCRQPLTSVQRGLEYRKRDIKLEEIKIFKTETWQRCSSYTRTHTCARGRKVNERWRGFDGDIANQYKILEKLTLLQFLKLVFNKNFIYYTMFVLNCKWYYLKICLHLCQISVPYSNSSVPRAPRSGNYCCTILKTIVEWDFILRDTRPFILIRSLKLALIIYF